MHAVHRSTVWIGVGLKRGDQPARLPPLYPSVHKVFWYAPAIARTMSKAESTPTSARDGGPSRVSETETRKWDIKAHENRRSNTEDESETMARNQKQKPAHRENKNYDSETKPMLRKLKALLRKQTWRQKQTTWNPRLSEGNRKVVFRPNQNLCMGK